MDDALPVDEAIQAVAEAIQAVPAVRPQHVATVLTAGKLPPAQVLIKKT